MAEPDPWQVTVRAAGTVLWRRTPTGKVEVAVVHRPRRRDWSLPKGKLVRGETAAACAVRETREETGFLPVLGTPLGSVDYDLVPPGTGHKVVTYFAGHAGDGGFEPNAEVDELRWLHPDAATELLGYVTDREVLARFAALPADTRTVLLVRHGKAGKKSTWPGPDQVRPLSPAGHEQAEALRALLPLFGPRRVHAADRVRCVDTVAGLAGDLGVPVTIEPALTEQAYAADPVTVARRFAAITGEPGTPVVCSQGGVIPGLIGTLAEKSGLELSTIPCKKGSTWVLSFSATKPQRLLAAHYLASPLPVPLTGPAPPAAR